MVEGITLHTDSERGATAAEYLGIVVVVGLLIAVLAVSDIGETIRETLRNAISSVSDNAGQAN